MKKFSCLIIAFFCTVLSVYSQRDTIKSIDDVPRFTYQIDSLASVVYNDDDQFRKLYLEVEKNYLSLKEKYVIEDATLKKSILSTLQSIDFFEQRFDEGMAKTKMIKSLQEKPAQKETSGLLSFTYLNTLANNKATATDEFSTAYQVELQKLVDPLDYAVVGDNIKSSKTSMEIFSENLIEGLIVENIDPASKGGELSGDFANALINYKFLTRYILPYKNNVVHVYKAYLDANHVEKKDIWKERNVDLSNRSNLSPVTIAIWDSGVDNALYPDNMYVNSQEKVDNVDNDGNGFIDDINGIAYDLHSNKIAGNLIDLSDEQKVDVPQTLQLYKGLKDLQTNIDSEEADRFKKVMSELKPDEVKPFIENLNFFGNYAHGTHVAGIAVHDNPAAVLQVARITFGYKLMPELPTIEKAKKNAKEVIETVNYFKSTGVRVVNMSFGGSPQGIETALEKNGVGKDSEERKEMAREIFDIGKVAFYDAIADADAILFITSSGNSDEDSEFYEAIPSSFDLPNILTVGAVDQTGEETSFSSFGENVDVHANGFDVESYVPGGERLKMSGTSMSSPNVANLAGKIWAINPDLSVEDVKNYIISYSDVSEDGRIILMNPKASINAVDKDHPPIKKQKNAKKIKS
ncbi:S8 family serine peptidase [Lutimonas halocynthiae]|uniref:S8 family serine peptidase n=1 Tax=Lutimonas halocynthiae TaxID=1446477 RepID=UPI0025B2FF2C|nr:S8 family serine peptidase [Lutimonas halocynthiae]MDN3643062.1 S8 family serine peptidase [Lutimonas halocynthiae]